MGLEGEGIGLGGFGSVGGWGFGKVVGRGMDGWIGVGSAVQCNAGYLDGWMFDVCCLRFFKEGGGDGEGDGDGDGSTYR